MDIKGDKYITKKERVVSLVCDTLTGLPNMIAIHWKVKVTYNFEKKS